MKLFIKLQLKTRLQKQKKQTGMYTLDSYLLLYLIWVQSLLRQLMLGIADCYQSCRNYYYWSQNVWLDNQSRSTWSSSLVTLLHPQAQSSLKITNRSFRYAAPHLWNKLPPSLRVSCQSATSECSPPLPGSDSAPKSVVGVSHRVFHSRLNILTFSPDPFPRNLPLPLTDWFHGFLSRTCTEVSGVENIGQCGRLSQLCWLLGAL